MYMYMYMYMGRCIYAEKNIRLIYGCSNSCSLFLSPCLNNKRKSREEEAEKRREEKRREERGW